MVAKAAVALALTAASTAASTVGQFAQARAQSAQDKINARIADTQANQIDTQRREELAQSLGSVQSARAANNLGQSTTGRAILGEFRRVMDRDRVTEVGSKRSQAAALRASAKSRMSGARFSLLSGGLSTGKSLFQFGNELRNG